MWGHSLGWKDPLEEGMQHTPAFLPGEAHGERSLVGYSPRGSRVRHDWSALAHSTAHLLYPFIWLWALRLFPYPGHCKSCCSGHWGACVLSNYDFLRAYALPCIKQIVGTCYKAQEAQLDVLWWARGMGLGGGWEEGDICLHIAGSLHCTAETKTL